MGSSDLTSILQLVETKFGRGPSSQWKNRDFEDLNFQILRKTKTNISVHTLKRIFGKIKTDDYYLPQKATIKALKDYVNFEEKTQTTNAEHLESKEDLTKTANKSIPGKIAASVILAGLLLLGIFMIVKMNTSMSIAKRAGSIVLISTEGSLPKSAQFEYTTPNDKDSFYICYDGNFPPVGVPNGEKKRSTYYYQYPGLFKVRMWTKKQILLESEPVYVQTSGWQAFGFYNHQGPLDRMFPIHIQNCTRNGAFTPTKKDLFNMGMDTLKLVDVRLDNYHPTNINGDDFVLQARFKNSEEWPTSRCNSVFLNIVGKKEYILLHFANPGCSYWIHCRLSEKKMDKYNDNLNGFVFNLSEWQNLRVENKNKQISVYINNVLRYSNSYTKSIGELVGVTVHFQGNGFLESFNLSDKNKKPVFEFPE